MKSIAIIPARGGSKRIPGKNIKLFHGKPIIAYPIEVAIRSKIFERIIVSTDSQIIAETALNLGAEVPFLRSEQTSGDQVPIAISVLETLFNLEDKEEKKYDQLCCLFATAPFVTVPLLNRGFKLLTDSRFNSVFTVQKHSSPIFRSLTYNSDGYLKMIWDNHTNSMSQEFQTTYRDAGQMYWIKIDTLKKEKSFYASKSFGLEIDRLAAHDIDTPEDWIVAERLYEFNTKHDASSAPEE